VARAGVGVLARCRRPRAAGGACRSMCGQRQAGGVSGHAGGALARQFGMDQYEDSKARA
jgi:hypothetical protein